MWYITQNYGFFACIALLGFLIIIIPSLWCIKSSGGMSSRGSATNEIKKHYDLVNTNPTMKTDPESRISPKKKKKDKTDSIHPWMHFHVYSIINTESSSKSIQKFTIFMMNIMVFLAISALCFRVSDAKGFNVQLIFGFPYRFNR